MILDDVAQCSRCVVVSAAPAFHSVGFLDGLASPPLLAATVAGAAAGAAWVDLELKLGLRAIRRFRRSYPRVRILVSRHLRGWDWPSRLYVAAASGVLSAAFPVSP